MTGLVQRRRLLGAGVAVSAAVAGAGLAWRHRQTTGSPPPNDPLAVIGFWALKFDTPAGKSLDMSAFKGRLLLVNFWATWCPPCVQELPLLNRFYAENSKNGWQVLGVAVDQPDAVNRFLAQMPLGFSVALAGMAGVGLSKSLGNLSGGLPFTVVIGSDGAVLHRKMGQVSLADLSAWTQLR
jgi:thiol-disulfide isomerase/thioredoxin